ncbi:hypothetical protein [Actinomadura violacea]|uniref:Uncharacterized protein n=1 Tax=Actinomadura violacea TaxID=2819934 RepID=A0ABS3RRI9_9ACTN|nr:hypothetical protein [Actinomadura violacea]MBO2459364.1 hypothetical protein [Actinomadura violacea]
MDENEAFERYGYRDPHNEQCDYCTCCSRAQCSSGHTDVYCPENSVGESLCPCTCD